MAFEKAKIGVIGCGAISGAYLSQCPQFEILENWACADLLPQRAKDRAEEFEVPHACETVEELLAMDEIEIVLNLTIPKAHHSVAMAAVEAGKSVWNEKPLTITREQGRELLAAAEKQGVLVGCAPDTFLGGGHQTCFKLINDGWIGEPIASASFMLNHGHESWHPDPEFYYKPGGGPMFDMGPYYLTQLVAAMGPARRVSGATSITFPERIITTQNEKYGDIIEVEVPTHVAGTIEFANGAIGTIIQSFDIWGANLPLVTIYGTEGTLYLPDPNGPGGSVEVLRHGSNRREVPLSHPYADLSRSIGVADMAYALRTGRPHRASGELAYHVLDLMHAFHDAADSGCYVELESTCAQPAPLPLSLRRGALDE
jgi:predicted dehydrogenase